MCRQHSFRERDSEKKLDLCNVKLREHEMELTNVNTNIVNE